MRYRFLRFPEGKAKAVTLSYDDGCPQDIRFSAIISSYGLKCTFNLNGDELRGEKALTKEEITDSFLSKGHEIAVHGSFHRAEGLQRPIDGIRDVLDCRLELENRYGMIIRGMAYPDSGITRFANSASYAQIRNYLSELDIAYARTLGGDNDSFEMPTDWYAWMPTAHHTNPKIFDYITKFVNLDLSEKCYGASRQPRLFYLWGHSYEFDRNNNWELLDSICEGLAGREDIWYATNIEIYNYTSAYNSLIYSADGTIVYNPTVTKVWFVIDGKLYSIGAGETLKI